MGRLYGVCKAQRVMCSRLCARAGKGEAWAYRRHVALRLPSRLPLQETEIGTRLETELAEEARQREVGRAHQLANDVQLRHSCCRGLPWRQAQRVDMHMDKALISLRNEGGPRVLIH